MIEWEYSRNQRRHTHAWLDRKKDIVYEFQIRATNQGNDVNYAKAGYDLYLTNQKTDKLSFIKHGRTVKELKQHTEKQLEVIE